MTIFDLIRQEKERDIDRAVLLYLIAMGGVRLKDFERLRKGDLFNDARFVPLWRAS